MCYSEMGASVVCASFVSPPLLWSPEGDVALHGLRDVTTPLWIGCGCGEM